MAVQVHIDLTYQLSVNAPFDAVLATLSHVPTSASFFPKVDQLVDLGDQSYRWEMAKIGVAQIHLQTIYACRYTTDVQGKNATVRWSPLPGVGNAQVQGHWAITGLKNGTQLELGLQGDLTLPLPGLMKKVVAPVVEAEFEGLVDRYLDNLITHFGGELG